MAIVPGPGEAKDGKHIVRKKYSGQPITFSISLSASAAKSGMGTIDAAVSLAVTTTDKSVTLTRQDGGILTELDEGGDEANTLLSWTGVYDGVGYDNLPDGGPGKTTQTLTGVVGGTWSLANFINPSNNQSYQTANIKVEWSGASPGNKTCVPPAPDLTVTTTTYSGDMPTFSASGTEPKTEDWKYKATDLADGTQLEQKCHWVAHYVHENWMDLEETGASLESKIMGPTIAVGIPFDEDHQTVTVPYFHKVSIAVATLYTGGITGNIQNNFELRKYHIGIDEIRNAFGKTKTLESGEEGVETDWEVHWSGVLEGNYNAAVAAIAPIKRGTIDVWDRKGDKGAGLMRFASADAYELKGITLDEPGGSN